MMCDIYNALMSRAQFSTENFAKFCGPAHEIPRLKVAKSSKFRDSPWPHNL